MSRTKRTSALIVPLVGVVFLLGSQGSEAKGCLKGAVVGAVAGHLAGHHAVLGAVAGCVIGHHLAKKKEEEQRQQRRLQQAPRRDQHADGTETVRSSLATAGAGMLA